MNECVSTRYWWLLFLSWLSIKWLHKWLRCNEELLDNVGVWWMQCCFHWVCWHGIKNLQHVKVWKGDGKHEEWIFGELFLKRCFSREQG
jgi:hypothetical protein